ncbi:MULTISPECIES: serine protease inhibitor ecotin [Tatumella]|uniref:Serine protease inhibitor ecotin n=1 Tax=Tatumella punctata TaxID=399969 RepID=A0ABW1VPN5_9GAMM|nr:MULTISPECIES: serine protease inhibitor ecotin [unclassified Tatumella]MBS0856018.1 serine protease inhibitor ecotin [Tatumella sp. JGM16]MBS0878077.1 serine protease inhibitor ecotin [Tatumella sp. JGM82]MBS0890436.1 serine protease inhibitor ecotin [Tatumella sp. JGM94]MBS0894675.1 serine protease inhibitor ecotin [Tatumella sp. JGM130]MBS0900892.1 serine protease inhibitor ecotin [Tatumella sp. JGM100]
MIRLSVALVFVPAILFGSAAQAATADAEAQLKPYPPAAEHMQRHVMLLPVLADEPQHRVELIIGKQMLTDCNQVRLAGELSEQTVKGWGYPYYQVSLQPGAVSTRMACVDTPKKNTLVTLPAAGEQLLRYNSKLPLVVYAPEGVQVSYRVWQAGKQVISSQVR